MHLLALWPQTKMRSLSLSFGCSPFEQAHMGQCYNAAKSATGQRTSVFQVVCPRALQTVLCPAQDSVPLDRDAPDTRQQLD